jgi:hypothetical protein
MLLRLTNEFIIVSFHNCLLVNTNSYCFCFFGFFLRGGILLCARHSTVVYYFIFILVFKILLFIFYLSYINNTKGFHCDNSIHA